MTNFESYGRPWTYRGYVCVIDRVPEEDVTQYFAEVLDLDANLRTCDLGRRESGSPAMIELWIDAGMPRRPRGQVGPLSKEQLEAIIAGCTERRCNDQQRHILYGCPMVRRPDGVIFARGSK